MLTLTPKVKRTLESIIRQAEAIRPANESEDEQMYYLIGSIATNAEDALAALSAERESAKLSELFDALRAGSVTINGTRIGRC